jgi:hypothetical protein
MSEAMDRMTAEPRQDNGAGRERQPERLFDLELPLIALRKAAAVLQLALESPNLSARIGAEEAIEYQAQHIHELTEAALALYYGCPPAYRIGAEFRDAIALEAGKTGQTSDN